ncbi:MAG: hypothetical protein B6V02_01990 [Thermoprotei archaeon ex4572_64]|nr:MAG: hypothetical protein B6V02_01990 [Thermoprotei archaeon ex4572_64]
MNGYIKWKCLIRKGNSIIDISNYITGIRTSKSFQSTNNSATIEVLDNDILYPNGVFFPEEDSPVEIYAKLVTSTADAELTLNDNIWTGKYMDFKRSESLDERRLTLKIVDWGFDIFNKFSKTNYFNKGFRTNEVIIDMVKQAVENNDGTGLYPLNFVNVASLRNDGTPFPVIEYSEHTKPNSEMIEELGGITWTNTELEQNNPIVTLPMIFDIRATSVYWFEQTLNQVLVINNDTVLLNISNSTNNESSSNFLILDCGLDLNGNPITTFIQNEASTTGTQKESFKKRGKIAGLNDSYDREFHPLKAEAISQGWSNSEFRDKVRELAKSYSDFWFSHVGVEQPNISVSLPRLDIELGETVLVNRKNFINGKYRVIQIGQNIGSEWSTTLTLEKQP